VKLRVFLFRNRKMTDIYKEAFEFLKTKELFNYENFNSHSKIFYLKIFCEFSTKIEHIKDRIEAKNWNCLWFRTFWLGWHHHWQSFHQERLRNHFCESGWSFESGPSWAKLNVSKQSGCWYQPRRSWTLKKLKVSGTFFYFDTWPSTFGDGLFKLQNTVFL